MFISNAKWTKMLKVQADNQFLGVADFTLKNEFG
jgi:hypothetical protein